jgi:hypothetical protein
MMFYLKALADSVWENLGRRVDPACRHEYFRSRASVPQV